MELPIIDLVHRWQGTVNRYAVLRNKHAIRAWIATIKGGR